MFNVAKVFPFGFCFEIINNSCAFTQIYYDIFLNDSFYKNTNQNIVSIFGLKSETDYKVELIGTDNHFSFNVKTSKMENFLNIQDYNAFGDGISDDSASFSCAISSSGKDTTIIVPKGIYCVNHIFLKSNINIYLEEGAVIQQICDCKHLGIIKGLSKNTNTNPTLDCYCALVYGKNVENVCIYGDGVFDISNLNSSNWHNPKIHTPIYKPKIFQFVYSKNITLAGFSMINGPSWNIHPFYCQDMYFINLDLIYNQYDNSSETIDGINPESCKNIHIIGCNFDIKDNCISIRSGKYFMSENCHKSSKNIEIRNCFMKNCKTGIVIGSEISCGIYNLKVTNCYFYDVDNSFYIKTKRNHSNKPVISDMFFNNIKIDKVKHCFAINMLYKNSDSNDDSFDKSKLNTYTPKIENIKVQNIVATDIKGTAIFVNGLPESNIQNLDIINNTFCLSENRIFEFPDNADNFDTISNMGIFIENAKNIKFENNEIAGARNDLK